MYKVMPTIPASKLRIRQGQILGRLNESPILLTQRGHGDGVLVHPRVWNDVMEVYQLAQEAGLLEKRFGKILDSEEDEQQWPEAQHVAEASGV